MSAQLDCLFKLLVAECTLPHLITVLVDDELSLLVDGLLLLLFLFDRLLSSCRWLLLNGWIITYLLCSGASLRSR